MTAQKSAFEIQRVGATLVLTPQQNLSELQFVHFDEASRSILAQLEQSAARNIVLDFENTDYYGSTALGFFVKLWKRVRCVDGNMVFCHVSDTEREILEVTRLDGLWQIFPTRAEALEWIAQLAPSDE